MDLTSFNPPYSYHAQGTRKKTQAQSEKFKEGITKEAVSVE